MKCFQIELTKGYGYNEFREDLKKLFFTAGTEKTEDGKIGCPIVFLFADTQVVEESFIEDINNILNSGEVPNLFANDEWEKIISACRPGCKAAGIPSVIENLVYTLPGEEPLAGESKSEAIVQSAIALSELGMDLLKLEYPGSPQACRRLADSIDVPWAVLSAGVDFEEFTEVLRISCDDGGASGFIAGRALWKESIGMSASERAEFFTEQSAPRLDACREAISGRATPWTHATTGAR